MKKKYDLTEFKPADAFALIDWEFSVTRAPYVTVITLKNGQKYHGFIHGSFPDNDELEKEFKFRFIPNNNSIKFRDERDLKGVLNPDYSVVINAADVASISLENIYDKVS